MEAEIRIRTRSAASPALSFGRWTAARSGQGHPRGHPSRGASPVCRLKSETLPTFSTCCDLRPEAGRAPSATGTTASTARRSPASRSRRRPPSRPARATPPSAPARNSPSWLLAPMNVALTALTRPRIASGVSSWTSVCRITTLTMSALPLTTSATIDSSERSRDREHEDRQPVDGDGREHEPAHAAPQRRARKPQRHQQRTDGRRRAQQSQAPTARSAARPSRTSAAAPSRHRAARRTGRARSRRGSPRCSAM